MVKERGQTQGAYRALYKRRQIEIKPTNRWYCVFFISASVRFSSSFCCIRCFLVGIWRILGEKNEALHSVRVVRFRTIYDDTK